MIPAAILALAVSPAPEGPSEGSSEVSAGEAAAEAEATAPESSSKKTRPPPPKWQGIVRVGGLTDSGPLPDVSLAGDVTVGVNGPWVSFQAFGRAWLPRKARLPGIEEPGVSAWAYAFGPRACFRHAICPKVELPACLGVSIGQIRARPFGLADDPLSHHLWVEGDVTLGVTLTPLPWLAIVGAFESGFLFKSEPLMLGDTVYHKPTHTALRGIVALEFRFPNPR